jgi:flagellar hook-length control protein FliK
VASVASELSALHRPQPGARAHACAQLADAAPDQGSFGALLDGVADPAEPALPASTPSVPGQPTLTRAPDSNAAAATAPSSRRAAAGDGAKGPTQPTQPTPPADPAAFKGEATTGPAPSTDTKTIGRGDKPGIESSGAGEIDRPPMPAVLAPPEPSAAVDAGQSEPSVQGVATADDRHGDKTEKTEKSDKAANAAATAASADDQSSAQLAPLPQPVAVALTVPMASSTDASEAEDITPVMAALGNGARAARLGAPGDASALPAADDGAPPSEPSGTPSRTAPGEAQTAAFGSGSNAASSLANVGPDAVVQRPDVFAIPAEWHEWDGRTSEQDAARPASEPAAAQPSQGRNLPASPAGNLSQPPIAGSVQSLEAAPAEPARDKGSPAAHAAAADAPQPPDSSGIPNPANLTAPTNLAVATSGTSGATATTPNAPTGATAAPASTASAPAIPIAGLAVEIAARAHAGTNRFDIRLDPPELGRIDVRLDVDHDGKVTSHLVVERQATLDMLRREAPELQRSLQEAGLKTASDGLQFTLRDQGFGHQNPYPHNAPLPGGQRVIVPDSSLPTLDAVRGRYTGAAGNTGIDIRV